MKADRDTQQMPSSYLERDHPYERGFAGGWAQQRLEPPGQSLNTSEKHENYNDEENETYASCRGIAPLAAV
jgi:hypothetical protein